METLQELITKFNQELASVIEKRSNSETNQNDENFWQYTKLCNLLKQILETYTTKANINQGIILYLVHMFIPLIVKKGKQLELEDDELIVETKEQNEEMYFYMSAKQFFCGYISSEEEAEFAVLPELNNSKMIVQSSVYYENGEGNNKIQDNEFSVSYDENGLVTEVQIDKLLIIPEKNGGYNAYYLDYLSSTYTIEDKKITVTSSKKKESSRLQIEGKDCIETYPKQYGELSSAIQIMLPMIPGVSGFDTTFILSLIPEIYTQQEYAPDSQIQPDEVPIELIWEVFPGIVNIVSDMFQVQLTREKVLPSTQ